MTTSTVSKHSRGALRLAATLVAAWSLAACGGGGVTTPAPASGGGGGTTVAASPYLLFASNYIAAQENGSFLHSVQNGDVYAGFGGLFKYGCYSFDQVALDKNQFYGIQGQANGDGTSNCGVVGNTKATTFSDFMNVVILAPGTNSTTKTSVTPLDISQSNTLLIQMGQLANSDATHANANVFTVILTDDTSLGGDGSGATATCALDVTLKHVGPDPTLSATGANNYTLKLTDFQCGGSNGFPVTSSIGGLKGDVPTLKAAGVTRVEIWISGDKNPGIQVGEFDTIIAGYIGFTM